MTSRHRRHLVAHLMTICMITVAAATMVACNDGRDAAAVPVSEATGIQVVDGQEFDDVFNVVGSLTLEESEAVVTVSPRAWPDPRGGFLVADSRENQVRIYSSRGDLERVFGDGAEPVPSIDRPQRAKRLPNGDILIANLQGPLTLIRDGSGREPTIFPNGLRTVRDIEILDDGQVLLIGTDSGPPSATIFAYHMTEARIAKAVLPPPDHLDRNVATIFSTVSTARWGDRIAAAHMLSDTMIFFDDSLDVVARVRIPIDPFVAPAGPLPNVASAQEQRAWTSQFTIISNVWWIDANALIVEWHKLTSDNGQEWGIVRMDTSGTRIWAIAPAPYLAAIRNGQFFFFDPQTDAPNEWRVAEQKGGR